MLRRRGCLLRWDNPVREHVPCTHVDSRCTRPRRPDKQMRALALVCIGQNSFQRLQVAWTSLKIAKHCGGG